MGNVASQDEIFEIPDEQSLQTAQITTAPSHTVSVQHSLQESLGEPSFQSYEPSLQQSQIAHYHGHVNQYPQQYYELDEYHVQNAQSYQDAKTYQSGQETSVAPESDESYTSNMMQVSRSNVGSINSRSQYSQNRSPFSHGTINSSFQKTNPHLYLPHHNKMNPNLLPSPIVEAEGREGADTPTKSLMLFSNSSIYSTKANDKYLPWSPPRDQKGGAPAQRDYATSFDSQDGSMAAASETGSASFYAFRKKRPVNPLELYNHPSEYETTSVEDIDVIEDSDGSGLKNRREKQSEKISDTSDSSQRFSRYPHAMIHKEKKSGEYEVGVGDETEEVLYMEQNKKDKTFINDEEEEGTEVEREPAEEEDGDENEEDSPGEGEEDEEDRENDQAELDSLSKRYLADDATTEQTDDEDEFEEDEKHRNGLDENEHEARLREEDHELMTSDIETLADHKIDAKDVEIINLEDLDEETLASLTRGSPHPEVAQLLQNPVDSKGSVKNGQDNASKTGSTTRRLQTPRHKADDASKTGSTTHRLQTPKHKADNASKTGSTTHRLQTPKNKPMVEHGALSASDQESAKGVGVSSYQESGKRAQSHRGSSSDEDGASQQRLKNNYTISSRRRSPPKRRSDSGAEADNESFAKNSKGSNRSQGHKSYRSQNLSPISQRSRNSLSPSRRSLSPSRRSLSPSRRNLSPSRRGLSPSRRSLSPSRRASSPSRSKKSAGKNNRSAFGSGQNYIVETVSPGSTFTSKGSLNKGLGSGSTADDAIPLFGSFDDEKKDEKKNIPVLQSLNGRQASVKQVKAGSSRSIDKLKSPDSIKSIEMFGSGRSYDSEGAVTREPIDERSLKSALNEIVPSKSPDSEGAVTRETIDRKSVASSDRSAYNMFYSMAEEESQNSGGRKRDFARNKNLIPRNASSKSSALDHGRYSPLADSGGASTIDHRRYSPVTRPTSEDQSSEEKRPPAGARTLKQLNVQPSALPVTRIKTKPLNFSPSALTADTLSTKRQLDAQSSALAVGGTNLCMAHLVQLSGNAKALSDPKTSNMTCSPAMQERGTHCSNVVKSSTVKCSEESKSASQKAANSCKVVNSSTANFAEKTKNAGQQVAHSCKPSELAKMSAGESEDSNDDLSKGGSIRVQSVHSSISGYPMKDGMHRPWQGSAFQRQLKEPVYDEDSAPSHKMFQPNFTGRSDRSETNDESLFTIDTLEAAKQLEARRQRAIRESNFHSLADATESESEAGNTAASAAKEVVPRKEIVAGREGIVRKEGYQQPSLFDVHLNSESASQQQPDKLPEQDKKLPVLSKYTPPASSKGTSRERYMAQELEDGKKSAQELKMVKKPDHTTEKFLSQNKLEDGKKSAQELKIVKKPDHTTEKYLSQNKLEDGKKSAQELTVAKKPFKTKEKQLSKKKFEDGKKLAQELIAVNKPDQTPESAINTFESSESYHVRTEAEDYVKELRGSGSESTENTANTGNRRKADDNPMNTWSKADALDIRLKPTQSAEIQGKRDPQGLRGLRSFEIQQRGSRDSSSITPEERLAKSIVNARIKEALGSASASTPLSITIDSIETAPSISSPVKTSDILGSFDEYDLAFVQRYEMAFDLFVQKNLKLMAKSPQLVYNLRVAKLQKLLQGTVDAEQEIKSEIEAVEQHKVAIVSAYQQHLIDAARKKATLEISLKQELNTIWQATAVMKGKLTWQLILKNEKRAKRMYEIIHKLSRDKAVDRSSLIKLLPDNLLMQPIRDAVTAPPCDYMSEEQEKDLRQFQVDNAFMKAEVEMLEKKLSTQQVAGRKYAWVDAVLVRMDDKQLKKLKQRYQRKLQATF